MADEGASLTLVSFVSGEREYCAMLGSAAGAAAVLADPHGSSAFSSAEPPEPGRARLEGDPGALELAWTPAGPLLEFSIGIPAVRGYAVAATASSGSESPPIAGPGVAWELPENGFSAIRTAWAATQRHGLVMLVAGRPDDATGHGEELVGAARLIPDGDPYGYGEPLLSTEYDGAGLHTRATLELWPEFAEQMPERGAGTRVGGASLNASGRRLEAARFAWKLEGSPAIGGYEILSA
jgi:hypothetical protein